MTTDTKTTVTVVIFNQKTDLKLLFKLIGTDHVYSVTQDWVFVAMTSNIQVSYSTNMYVLVSRCCQVLPGNLHRAAPLWCSPSIPPLPDHPTDRHTGNTAVGQ